LVLLWLGFVFLEKSLSVNHIPSALNSLQKGKLIIAWRKAFPTISVIVKNSEPLSRNLIKLVTNLVRTDVENSKQAQCVSNLIIVLYGLPKLHKIITII
jgi:hypothetical protein